MRDPLKDNGLRAIAEIYGFEKKGDVMVNKNYKDPEGNPPVGEPDSHGNTDGGWKKWAYTGFKYN